MTGTATGSPNDTQGEIAIIAASITVKFTLGRVVATPGALAALALAEQSPMLYVLRHVSGDWGEVGLEDWQVNQEALQRGDRLLSVYPLPTGMRLWVITEADRSTTTLLLPSEY